MFQNYERLQTWIAQRSEALWAVSSDNHKSYEQTEIPVSFRQNLKAGLLSIYHLAKQDIMQKNL